MRGEAPTSDVDHTTFMSGSSFTTKLPEPNVVAPIVREPLTKRDMKTLLLASATRSVTKTLPVGGIPLDPRQSARAVVLDEEEVLEH